MNNAPASPPADDALPTLHADAASVPSAPSANKDKTAQVTPAPAANNPVAGALASSTLAGQDDYARKLIRNAALELEVGSFTDTSDKITGMARTFGGYVDSANTDRGGNGKLDGTLVVKLKPDKLDDFLLQVRGLGDVKNQSIVTLDVTKEYFDIQARLTNATKTEAQLQDLLARNNGKVSDLLAVEKEMDRVRGQIESLQGQVKLYDFQVQFATVTIQVREKDLHKTAKYLLKETDSLTLNTDDVDATFQNARQAVDDNKGQMLQAEVSRPQEAPPYATIQASIPPERIDPFLATLKVLGRVEGLQRHTERVAQDGGDSSTPADGNVTEKDNVLVTLTIALDFGGKQQVNITVVTKTVEATFNHIKELVESSKGLILSSRLNRDQVGNTSATLQIRVPSGAYQPMVDYLQSAGRVPAFSRNNQDDANGLPSSGAPIILNVSLTDDEPPVQTSEITVQTDDVPGKVDVVKGVLSKFEAELKTSNFDQQPNGQSEAILVIKLPLKQYELMNEVLKGLGRVESSSIHREDHPVTAITTKSEVLDDAAPAEIHLRLQSQPDLVPEENGFWSTIRHSFSQSVGVLGMSFTLLASLIAALVPFLLTGFLALWLGRRLYVWLKK